MTPICLIVPIASIHYRPECFAHFHSYHQFSMHHLRCFCLSETFWISRWTFSFTPRVADDPQLFAFLFITFFLYFFLVYVSNKKFTVFYLSILHSLFLLCLVGVIGTIHCPFSVLSEILTVLRMCFPSLSLQRNFPSPLLSSILELSICSILQRDRAKEKLRVYSNWQSTDYLEALLRVFSFYIDTFDEVLDSARWEKGTLLLSDHKNALQMC